VSRTENIYCSRCGDTRGGPYGHETNECTWRDSCAGCNCAQIAASVCLRRASENIAKRFEGEL
jgi:hypothetical protein